MGGGGAGPIDSVNAMVGEEIAVMAKELNREDEAGGFVPAKMAAGGDRLGLRTLLRPALTLVEAALEDVISDQLGRTGHLITMALPDEQHPGNSQKGEMTPYERAMLQSLLRKLDKSHHEDKANISVKPRDQTVMQEIALQRIGSVGLRAINALRMLAADAVENACSGHPGMPMGMAPAAFVLWDRHLRFNPANPNWINRDRFVLSTGHGSLLMYSLLYMFGYDSLTVDDLRKFRQYGSRTPGHPENDMTPGVEVMTGALGQGIANAVGLALAEKHLAATYNRDGAPHAIDHYTYCIVGDGCLMEGISSEASSLAAHWRLGKLIVFYDDNNTTIDGSTDIAFTEDVAARYRAYGWQVIHVADGDRDVGAIDDAVVAAKAETGRPTLIKITTTIGFGAPTKAGTSGVHGAALGSEELGGLRAALDWEHEPFEVPADVLAYTQRKVESGGVHERRWRAGLAEYGAAHPEDFARFDKYALQGQLGEGHERALLAAAAQLVEQKKASRHLSQAMLNALARTTPNLIGGSADLESSCMTKLKDCGAFQHATPQGRNVHFGVREHAMGSICNGIALYGGGLLPYCATFLVFSDYMRAAVRTAALSGAQVLFVMTHDSVLLGEDGPTHQPVEHVPSFRAMPNVDLLRPGNALETAACYANAVVAKGRPSVLVMSRQGLPCTWQASYDGARRGGYVVEEVGAGADSAVPELILIATGSEVALACDAARQLGEVDGRYVRVVSMPCVEAFERQERAVQEQVLPAGVPHSRRMVVEAASSFGWHKYAGNFHTVDEFGISAPGKDVARHFKLTAADVLEHAREVLAAN